jgi:hypothetical protein
VTFRRYLPLLLFYGALGYTTFNILLYVSVYFTSGVNASIEQVAINIFVMIGNFVVFRGGSSRGTARASSSRRRPTTAL